MGDNTVASRLLAAGTSKLWISTNVTKDADTDCAGTIAGTLLLFTFTKKASIVVNTDVGISHLFNCFAGAIWNLPHDIRVTGLFLQMRADRHQEYVKVENVVL